MFSKLILDNFKAFHHFEFDFTQNKVEKIAKNMCVIYGENAIGKSSIVDAFNLLNKMKDSITNSKFFESLMDKVQLNDGAFGKMGLNDSFVYSAPDYVPLYKRICHYQ